MRNKMILSLLILFIVYAMTMTVYAMTEAQLSEFDRIYMMSMGDLTETSEALLEKKYPDVDWDQFNFPSYVYTNDSVEIGYKIAVMGPGLLGKANIKDKSSIIPCYCFCDAMGHKNLLYCFLKNGEVDGQFDDHASGCNICYGQAMLAFLWANAGADHDEIIAGMEKRFKRLIKMQEERSR